MSDIKERYTFVDKPGDVKWTAIRIQGGKFDGVVYHYAKVYMPDDIKENSDGTLPFKFDYSIIENVGISRDNFGDEFFILIGDILVDIINDQLERDNLEYKPDN